MPGAAEESTATKAEENRAATAEKLAATAVKVSFNLPREELDALRELAARRHIPVTHALRQAVATERFFDHYRQQGSKILIQEPDGTVREIVFRD